MSDSPAFDFGKFIPGFDFLQNLATSAKGPAGPVSALHNWVAPTVSVLPLTATLPFCMEPMTNCPDVLDSYWLPALLPSPLSGRADPVTPLAPPKPPVPATALAPPASAAGSGRSPTTRRNAWWKSMGARCSASGWTCSSPGGSSACW